MIFKTDNILENFQLFKSIRLLLNTYLQESNIDKIPSVSEFYSRNMYNEWIELGKLIADMDNWNDTDWDNFITCMSLSEASKSVLDSINYALTGLRVVIVVPPTYSVKENKITLTIKVLKNVPYITEMKRLLQRCIEYLILAKESDITLIVELLELDANITQESGFSAEVNIGIFEESNSSNYNIDVSSIDIKSENGTYNFIADSTSELDGSYDIYKFNILPSELNKLSNGYYKVNVEYNIPPTLPKLDYPYVTYDIENNYLQVIKGAHLQSGTRISLSIYLDCILLTSDQIEKTRKEIDIIWG